MIRVCFLQACVTDAPVTFSNQVLFTKPQKNAAFPLISITYISKKFLTPNGTSVAQGMDRGINK